MLNYWFDTLVISSVQDSELNELRKTIELLKKQNAVAQAAINGVINTPELTAKGDRTGTGQHDTKQGSIRIVGVVHGNAVSDRSVRKAVLDTPQSVNQK